MTIERRDRSFFRSKTTELPAGSVEKINFRRILIVESPDRIRIKSSGDDFIYRDKKGMPKKIRFSKRAIPDEVCEREEINEITCLESRPSYVKALIGKIGVYKWVE